MSILNKLFGDANARVVRSYQPMVEAINRLEHNVSSLGDENIRQRLLELRSIVDGSSAKLDDVLPEVFAMTREASRRALQLRHFDVQLIGGIVLHQGKIAEMKTGEGKTLVATLPVVLNALTGQGVHIVTVNDYLAKRDAGWMGPIYARLGLTCAAIVHEASWIFDETFTNEPTTDPLLKHLRPISRREAYAADITYGTNNEFGFDYLRDNMVPSPDHLGQRQLHYAIVDEVDSILIDEARTPLIISAPVERSADDYRKIDQLVKRLTAERDFKIDEKMRSVFLTEAGITSMERMLGVPNIYSAADSDLLNIINQALRANSNLFERDKQYVVRNGEIVIVDEFTGRLMFGRRYSDGLHQAIEAKEGVEIKQESQTLATITFQNLFRMYEKLAGMTGTAVTEAEEFHKIYQLDVVVIPTHQPMIRVDFEDSVYKNEQGKFTAVVREIKKRHAQGQPILAGTISIAKNELLSALLQREGIRHEVLNAKNHEREAQIIAQAGRLGAVTIATNMAGRGVDIILGGNPPNPQEHAAVKERGGLHVIGTERHEARRIDLQLRGRSGRQGDPGSSQFFVSMEDDLMRIFGSDRMKNLMDRLGIPDDMPIENRMVSKSIEAAQKKVEGHNFDIRKHLVEYDDVMNKHREVIYRKRKEILLAEPVRLREMANKMIEQELETLVVFHTTEESPEQWKLDKVYDSVNAIFALRSDERKLLPELVSQSGSVPPASSFRHDLTTYLVELATVKFSTLLAASAEPDQALHIVRSIMLRTIDVMWIEHLDLMEHLREGIGLRGYGQRDPLIEYKREAYQLFTQLLNSINEQTAIAIFKLEHAHTPEQTPMARRKLIESAPAKTMADELAHPVTVSGVPSHAQPTSPKATFRKVGRNDPCPCGSGKKFKKCYLANDPGCKLRTQ